MYKGHRIGVVIPAYNEEPSIGRVLEDLPDWVDEIVVADNASTDNTAKVAEEHGAAVVYVPVRGYGSACQSGIMTLKNPDIVVFIDADYSDVPEEMDRLLDPVVRGESDFVIGSRVLGDCEQGALTPQQRWGNWLACRLMRFFWGVRHTDLGPFRAIRYSTLDELRMRDLDWGVDGRNAGQSGQTRRPRR